MGKNSCLCFIVQSVFFLNKLHKFIKKKLKMILKVIFIDRLI